MCATVREGGGSPYKAPGLDEWLVVAAFGRELKIGQKCPKSGKSVSKVAQKCADKSKSKIEPTTAAWPCGMRGTQGVI